MGSKRLYSMKPLANSLIHLEVDQNCQGGSRITLSYHKDDPPHHLKCDYLTFNRN